MRPLSRGFKTAPVIAVLGAAGLAVGPALQGSLSNLAAGVLLVMFRPFRAGEYVDLGVCCRYGTECAQNSFPYNNARGRRQNYCNLNGQIIAGNIINYSREPVSAVTNSHYWVHLRFDTYRSG
ncbi:mechanosensitive ion channel [Salmonella enterica subsp. enterica]|nr:mechanosensitive ion channel [Salmonella enterica subsp. enterica]